MNVSADEMAPPSPSAADLTSSGKISLVTTDESGTHDTHSPAAYMHTTATIATAYPRGIALPPSVPSSAPKIHAMATWHRISTAPPTMNRVRRPRRSTTTAATATEEMLTTSVMMDPRMAFWLVNPTV
ncbi:Os02g0574300 [Oryza sativa Japonica Group]|uniref:Os02g0574300 protein n=1 Tax=Oryza sativa subsp. japonica TaxID=39947 RepID=A0A0P0VKY5_ORYSJ|nr:hypothetical protein EE612_011948 [Oryza sativa]BAS79366.1 Os02g0574300 [Oryza sativa Japonica Group]